MPTPIDILTDPLTLMVLALYGGILLWEALAPARRLVPVPGWRLRGAAAFVAYVLVSTYVPLLLEPYLPRAALVDLGQAPAWLGLGGAVLVFELGLYAWHRSLHGFRPLWRVFHQMHHSAERHDAVGAYWFSPADMVGFTLLSTLVFTVVGGLSPTTITAFVLLTTFFSVFQHANVRTPRWLGYFIQRPESHSVHHAQTVHRSNYSDLPIFDLLFGTFANPEDFAERQGFYVGASLRWPEMLVGRDVSQPRTLPTPQIDPGRAVS